jgi:hypothetical protein
MEKAYNVNTVHIEYQIKENFLNVRNMCIQKGHSMTTK